MKRFFAQIAILLWSLFGMQDGYGAASSIWEMSAEEVRDRINEIIELVDAPVPSVYSTTDHLILKDDRETPIRIYCPSEAKDLPAILLIHGGAWVAGSIDTHDNLARYLCSKSGATVISVGYTNAPEGKFPLPLEQCYDALTYLSELNISQIAVVGDSAGGNLAAGLCLMNRDRGGPKITLQVLINPAPDLTCEGTLQPQNDSLDILRWLAIQYVDKEEDASHPYVSPATAQDLKNLPPAIVILAENDELRADGQKYADRLTAAGIPTFVYCQEGIGHLAAAGAKAAPSALPSLDVAVDQILQAFTNKEL
ncbi:MAG: Acetyl esterase [Chlamydiia bacterium]|nr:Acetyl esterase [Chlamydiia bacterium]